MVDLSGAPTIVTRARGAPHPCQPLAAEEITTAAAEDAGTANAAWPGAHGHAGLSRPRLRNDEDDDYND